MKHASPSPLREAVDGLREGILQTWVRDAVEAYDQAATLLGWPGERRRLRTARLGLLQTQSLVPAYQRLLDRYGARIGEGRQLTLPWEPHDERLRRGWSEHAIGFVRDAGNASVQRIVLQVSLGLAGPVDRQTAADLLDAAAAEHLD